MTRTADETVETVETVEAVEAVEAARAPTARAASANFGPYAQKVAYGVPTSLKGSNGSNWQMVWGSGTFGYREADLDMFFKTYSPSSRCAPLGPRVTVRSGWLGCQRVLIPASWISRGFHVLFYPCGHPVVTYCNAAYGTPRERAAPSPPSATTNRPKPSAPDARLDFCALHASA